MWRTLVEQNMLTVSSNVTDVISGAGHAHSDACGAGHADCFRTNDALVHAHIGGLFMLTVSKQ